MSTLEYILIFTFLGSIFSLIGGILLFLNRSFAAKTSHFLAAFAAGVFLSTAFFDLLPEAVHEAEQTNINPFFWVAAGILAFFVLERFIHWFHHHEEHHRAHKESKSVIPLIIASDTVHNFIDGVVIASTFLVSVPMGIITTFAVVSHEIPQEIGDFGLLLSKGMRRKNVILVNIASALVSFAGALLAYFVGERVEYYLPVFLAVAAGFFIYIALSDIIPEIHLEEKRGLALIESLILILGVFILWFVIYLFPEAS